MTSIDELFRLHAAAVLAYALRRTDAATAEDVVSEVFLVVGRRPDRIPEHDAQLWLYGVARRVLDLPGVDGLSAIYDLDPESALPERFTLTTRTVTGGKRYVNRLVLRFDTYERLPFTPASRANLRLLPHPGAGPTDDPAGNHFAVLRGDRRPDASAMRAIETFARHNDRMRLDAAGARVLGPRRFLVPGHGYLCLMTIDTGRFGGFGGGCTTVARAVERGSGSGTPEMGKVVVVPDGVSALRVRIRGGRRDTVAVSDNHSTLPFGAFAWQFVR